MRARNRTPILTNTTYWYYDWAGSGFNTSNVSGYQDSFSFTGFGSNDRKKRRLPTAGTYQIILKEPFIGQRTKFVYRSNGALYHSSNQVGYLRPRGGHTCYPEFYQSQMSYSTAVYNDAVNRVYQKIRESETNLAVSLGEARETKRMVEGAVKGALEVVSWARKAKREFLRNPSKSLSEIWLGYKYGWQPAISDVYNLLDWSSRHFDEMTFVGRRSLRRPISDSQDIPYGDPDAPGVRLKATASGYITNKCEVSVTCSVSDTVAFDRSRITSLNPLAIAWELMPLSFVVDWFVNVGGYLESLEASIGSGLSFKRGYVTELCLVDVHCTESGSGSGFNAGFYSIVYTYDQTRARFANKRRVLLTGFPRPRIPSLSVNLGVSRLISATALLRTVLLGKVG